MVGKEARKEARRALERRLLQERALFAGALATFVAVLYLDLNVSPSYDLFVYALIAACGLTGAGLDGAREGLKDLDLIAGFLEHEGPGARITRVPFWSRGHYELWFETPAPGGPRRLGLSFANSFLYREKRSIYLLMVPLGPATQQPAGAPPRKPFREMGTGGTLEGKVIEYYLWRPARGGPAEPRLLVYLTPGRPLDLPGLLDLKRRGEEMAARVGREGPGAVPWGTTQAFRRPSAVEIPPQSRAQLRDPKG